MKRMSARAPLNTVALYSWEGEEGNARSSSSSSSSSKVFRGQCLNISEGGALIEHLWPPRSCPKAKVVPLIVSLPIFFDFRHRNLNALRERLWERKIIRLKAQPIRKVSRLQIGYKFLQLSKMGREEVRGYVTGFAQNTLFLLNALEAHDGPYREDPEMLKTLGFFLGHKKDQDLSLLRQRALHDYQSFISF